MIKTSILKDYAKIALKINIKIKLKQLLNIKIYISKGED